MEKELVHYEQALVLKELGFDEPCFGYYIELRNPQEGILIIDKCENSIDGVLAPTFSQAFRWFREKHNLEASIQRMPPEVYGKGKGDIKNYLLFIWAENLNPRGQQTLHFDTYEEAELECLKKLIELCKKV